MGVLIDNRAELLEAFGVTLRLFAYSAVLSLLLGTVLAVMRVSPVPVLRLAGTAYVNVARNTPLVLVFVFWTFGMQNVGVRFSFFGFAVAALTAYTSAFVCEGLRSGINAVDPGQAEAARALGMTFGQNIALVVLPQAMRAAIPPIASVLIAMVRNTAIASAFGVTELGSLLADLLNKHPQSLYAIFLGIAAAYMSIVAVIAVAARLLERRLLVAR